MNSVPVRMLLLAFCLAVPGQTFAQFQQVQRQSDDLFLLAPRSLMRLLREGEAAIADGRYTDAVNALGALLLDDSSALPGDLRGQDFFVEPGLKGLYQKSVKGEAIRLLSDLPPEGRRTLEIQFGVTARQKLNEAIAKQDFVGIGEVAREYVHCEAGYDAQVLMAQHNMTAGYPLAAAGIMQNLLDYPAARSRFGVQLAYASAIAWLQAGERDMAIGTLRMAVRDFPGASLTIDGQQISVDASTDWGLVLDRQAETLALTAEKTPDAWLTAGGSPQRSARAEAGMPLPNHRWKKDIHSSVPERESLLEVEDAARKSGTVIMPKFELRMLDGTIITKTTDGGVLGVNFDTGNIEWERYFGSSAAPLKSLAWGGRAGGQDTISRELQDRVWGSTAFGRVSCDPERFYYISREGEQPLNPRTILNGRISAKDSNYLEGVSIAAQGAILWRVGGIDGEDEPKLAGAYFLGPPLAYEGRLYSLLEINGETKLAVLEPETGKLLWTQQLVQAAQLPIRYDDQRQAQALSPSIADGVILCPTGVGAVVAVDLLSRSLRWGATYVIPSNNNRFGGAFGMTPIEYQPLGARWEDTAMIASRGIVVYSPPESQFLSCRDILTGAPIIASHPRRTARYVAGLHEDHLVLVSEGGASAISLRDKRVAWEMDFPPGLALAGTGLWQKDSMLIPLTSRTVIRVRLDDGAITGQAVVDQELGNLFAYRDQLLSVNSTSISAYYTKDALSGEVERRLEANPLDTWALNQKSQILSAEGRIDEAMALLKKSFELNSQSADTRFLMVDTLLEALQQDFAKYSHLADSLDEVVELGSQRFRFLQQLALGKLQSGDHLAAFERLYELMNYQMDMADKSQGRSSKVRLGERHSVDSDAWITAELARTYAAASEDEQRQMRALVDRSLAAVKGTMVPLRRQRLRYLAWLPPAAPSLLELGTELLGGDEQTTAEQLLQPVLMGSDPELSEIALQLLRQPAEADRTLLGPAGRDYANPSYGRDASQASKADADDSKIEWNRGRVEHRAIKEYAIFSIGRRLEVTGERYGRPDIAVALSDSLLAISNQNGENVGHLLFNPASSDLTNAYTRTYIRGGLLIIETATEVAAFDLYSGFSDQRDALLWRFSLVGAAPDEQFFGGGMSNAPNAILGITIPRRQMPGDQQATVGPLTPAALVIQNGTTVSGLQPLTGRVLWSREGYGNDLRFAAEGNEVAIVNPSEGKTEIVDCRDGTLIRESDFRGNWTHWLSHGPMLVDFRKGDLGTSVTIRVWNALTGEVFQDIGVPFSARAEVCENRYVVVAEPMKSKLHYIDLEKLLYQELDLPVDRNLTGIAVERFEDRIVVLSNAESGRRFGRTPMEHVASGYVYAIDIASGKPAWSRPGRLGGMAFPLKQPRHSPFMVVERFEDVTLPDSQSGAVASVALIDLRDGSLAFADDAILVRTRALSMRLKPTEQALELAVGDRNYQFRFTNEAQPPQPVFVYGNSR